MENQIGPVMTHGMNLAKGDLMMGGGWTQKLPNRQNMIGLASSGFQELNDR
jgi:hypothetical protein